MSPAKLGVAELVSRLRASASSQDSGVQAAVELLIDHDFWLRKSTFVQRFVNCAYGSTFVDWFDVDEALTAKVRELMVASSSELAVLQLAVFLARDPMRLAVLGTGNAEIAARAFARALGVAR